MLFSLVGEIGLIVIGSLWVLERWFSSFIDLMEVAKNDDEKEKEPELSEAAKKMYS